MPLDALRMNPPDEAERLIWTTHDVVIRLLDRSPALARQAARAALEAAREVEELNRRQSHTAKERNAA